MFLEDEKRFQSSNKFSICNKILDVKDNKVRDHDHITEKYAGFAHCICNKLYLKLGMHGFYN